jgi:hypothetical protein
LKRFLVLTIVALGLGFAGGWVVSERVDDDEATTTTVTETRATEGPPPQAGLPEPVAAKRAQIWEEARAKDYEGLAALVDPAGFEYTFGGPVPGGPAAHWRQLEPTERPVETLAAILELPFVVDPTSELYVWPYAFLRPAATLSAEERQQLVDALGEDAVRAYEQSGNYLGYRAGIDSEGNWVFYVAGD